ncbi:MAG: zinc finger domain-containing protein [Patescibacteria group bacterium]
MFGFGGGSKRNRGRDIETEVDLTFKESIFGVTKTINLYRTSLCTVCKGDGAEPGTSFETCADCKGEGRVRQAARTMFGTMQTVVTCNTCHGKGKKPKRLASTAKVMVPRSVMSV